MLNNRLHITPRESFFQLHAVYKPIFVSFM